MSRELPQPPEQSISHGSKPDHRAPPRKPQIGGQDRVLARRSPETHPTDPGQISASGNIFTFSGAISDRPVARSRQQVSNNNNSNLNETDPRERSGERALKWNREHPDRARENNRRWVQTPRGREYRRDQSAKHRERIEANPKLTERARIVLNGLVSGESISAREYQVRFGIHRVTACEDLRAMVRLRLLIPQGDGPRRRYVRASQ